MVRDWNNGAVRGSFDPAQHQLIINRFARGQKTHARHFKVDKNTVDSV
jgi:hypothetical protein